FNSSNALIKISGLANTSSTAYNPCFRIDGRTSCVIHLLNFLAFGLFERIINVYKPLSFIQTIFCGPPRVSTFIGSLSSASSFSTASRCFDIPKTSQTSFATHHGLHSLNTVLTELTSKSNTFKLYIILMNLLQIVVE